MHSFFTTLGKTAALAACLTAFSGCASIVSKSSYPISIISNPPGATISIKDRDGATMYNGTTPATLKLKSGAGFFKKASYSVTFDLEGYERQTLPVHFTLDGWYFGNIIFGGLIGLLIVDPATGAMWRLDTKFLNANLNKITASTDEPSLKVLGLNDIPEDWKQHLVRVN